MSAEAFGDVRREELLIHVICGLLDGCRHVAVGTMSPIPGSGALLAREKRGMRVTVLGSDLPEHRSDGGMELFDMAGQGRMDAFFLSGGQIDGQANINLHGAGAYPNMKVRWSGAFGSAYLYFEVPRVILFREEHSPRVFVEQVDFISAPGVSPPGVRRRGGPHALVTELCLMMFDRERARFSLASLHPGVTLEEVRDRTGFDFDAPEEPPTTGLPDAETLALIRGPVAHKIAEAYPEFGRAVFGVEAAA
ncbi:MAG: CoA-transferase [Pseudomonadota bacterium]